MTFNTEKTNRFGLDGVLLAIQKVLSNSVMSDVSQITKKKEFLNARDIFASNHVLHIMLDFRAGSNLDQYYTPLDDRGDREVSCAFRIAARFLFGVCSMVLGRSFSDSHMEESFKKFTLIDVANEIIRITKEKYPDIGNKIIIVVVQFDEFQSAEKKTKKDTKDEKKQKRINRNFAVNLAISLLEFMRMDAFGLRLVFIPVLTGFFCFFFFFF
jgi:hypothetical protein